MVPSRLAYGVLGPLEIRRDGSPVPLPSLRQRAVLAALLAAAGQPVSGDALIQAAWGDDLPANPRPALHTLLSRLRSLLGVDAIRGGPAGYRLVAGPEAVDGARFEALHREARHADAGHAGELLERGLALWRGPAYAEFADRDFAAAEAVRLDELRLTGREDLAEVWIEAGEAATALPVLAAYVSEHPLRERARELLMIARYRAGRVSEAFDTYHDYRKLLADELGLDPSPALRDLHQRLLSHEAPAGAPVRPAAGGSGAGKTRPGPGRPVADAAFIGRDDEAADLAGLAAAHRLVTVTGTGGVGKTRLVAETHQLLAGQLALPVTIVELAGVDQDRVDTAIATALGVGPSGGEGRAAVLDYLSVVPALLVIDGCEHVISQVRGFALAALRRCPGARIVATSRHRIGLPAEQVLPLEPLATPDAGSPDARLTAAVRLFADRARRVRPAFELTDALLPAVADVCRRLDGLPLAIELAATRAATLGVEPLRERLDHSLDLLGEGGRDGERSLRAVLDWSYGLLDGPDRTLLAGLGGFEGEFDLDGAEQVVAGLVDRPVAVGLARLVDASLVATRRSAGAARYRLLEIVRTFARERLVESGAEHTVRAAHARWVRTVVRAAAGDSRGAGEVAPVAADSAVSAVTGETAPVVELATIAASAQAAVGWALRAGEPELAGDIAEALMLLASAGWQPRLDLTDLVRRIAWHPDVQQTRAAPGAAAAGALAATLLGDLETGERAARAALERATGVDGRCLALLALGIVTLYRGDHRHSRSAWQALLAPELPPVRHVNGHASLALIACYEGELPEARRHAAHATAIAEATGAQAGRAFARYASAEVAAAEDPATAVPLLVDAVREADRAGVDLIGGVCATALLAALTRLDHTDEALAVLGPLLERWLRLAAWPQLWTTLRTLAELLAGNGRPEEATLLLAAADRAPSAPAVAGTHAARYAQLAEDLRERISPRAYEKIAVLAGVLPRTAVVDRARAVVAELTGSRSRRP